MHDHHEICELLPLAAAGALSAGEQHRVQEHLNQCAQCSTEFAGWSRLVSALEEIPTPQAPLGLMERTRRALEKQAEIHAERRRQRWLFFWLNVFAWATTLLTWTLFRFFAGSTGDFFDLAWIHIGAGSAWLGYMFLTGTIGALAVGLLGKRRMQEERTI